MSYFIAPAIVGLFINSIGAEGVIWIFASLYFAGAVLMRFMKLPEEEKQEEGGNLTKRPASVN